MADDWLEDIGDYLEDEGVGTTGSAGNGWDIYGDGRSPKSPEQAIILTHTGGIPPAEEIQGLRGYTFQVKVVGSKDAGAAAYAKINQIYTKLAGYQSIVKNRTFEFFQALQHPAFLEYDKNNNPVYVNNYQTLIKE